MKGIFGKNLEITISVIALAIGALLSIIYSSKIGGVQIKNVSDGALQLYSKDGFLDVTLISKKLITPDSYLFTFQLPDPNVTLGIGTGQHIFLHAPIKDSKNNTEIEVARKYTPISRSNQTGSFTLLIKIYRPGVDTNFPDGGKLTPFLEKLNPGDIIKISGPRGKLRYVKNGEIYIEMPERKQTMTPKKIGLIAGGSGITPMFQLIQTVLENPDDPTIIHLLFANKSEEDILLKEQLDKFSADPRLKVFYTLDKPKPEWTGQKGFVSKDMIIETMPGPNDNVLICTCGPRKMNEMLAKHLADLGYKEDHVFKF